MSPDYIKAEAVGLIRLNLRIYFDAIFRGADEKEAIKLVLQGNYPSEENKINALLESEKTKNLAKSWSYKNDDGNWAKTIIFDIVLFLAYPNPKSILTPEFVEALQTKIDEIYDLTRRICKVERGIYKYEGGNGKSIEEAIVIKGANDTKEGIALKYDYISNLYGERDVDWKLQMQALMGDKERPCDKAEIILKNGEKKEFYFDITEFFGKHQPQATIQRILGQSETVPDNKNDACNEPTKNNTKSSVITSSPPYDSCAYLDIETTGFSPSNGDITVIGIYLEKGEKREFISLVDNDINPTRLGEIFKDVNLLYTYNGSAFDLPFIQTKLGLDITRCCKHIDLMEECHGRGIYGGLKETERKLGINRKWDIHGREAVALWYKYKYEGNKEALNTLLEYNKEDTINLSQIKRKLAEIHPNTEIQKYQEGYERHAIDYGVGRLHDAETRKPQEYNNPAKYESESESSQETGITTLGHTRVAPSPQKTLQQDDAQQDDKPKMWHEEHPVADAAYGCLIFIIFFILLILIAVLLK